LTEWDKRRLPDGKKASRKYDGGGRVDRVGEEELVVNDFSLRLARDVVCHSPQGEGLSPKLEIGSMILYKLNDEREIVSIWFVDNQQSSGEE
jgi:hypothetical protein